MGDAIARLKSACAIGRPQRQAPKAASPGIALDATGLMIGDEGAVVETARHVSMVLDDPVSTTLVSLWQRNLVCIRAERYLQIALRADAVAFASAAGSPA